MMVTPDTPPPVLRRGIMDTSSKLPPMQKQNQSLKSLAPSITEDYLVNVLSLADNMWHVETQRCRHSFSPRLLSSSVKLLIISVKYKMFVFNILPPK